MNFLSPVYEICMRDVNKIWPEAFVFVLEEVRSARPINLGRFAVISFLILEECLFMIIHFSLYREMSNLSELSPEEVMQSCGQSNQMK